jgi:hypothetical protein
VFVNTALSAEFLPHIIDKEFQPFRPLRPICAIDIKANITQVSPRDAFTANASFSHNIPH